MSIGPWIYRIDAKTMLHLPILQYLNSVVTIRGSESYDHRPIVVLLASVGKRPVMVAKFCESESLYVGVGERSSS